MNSTSISQCETSTQESDSLSYHPAVQIPLETVCFGGLVTGIIANNIIIWIILANKSMRGRTNWYIFNLCVANCLVVLSVLPLNVVHLSGTCEVARSLFTDESCVLIVYFSETMPDVSMVTLTMMVVERYFAFVHPLLAIRINGIISLRSRIAISWIMPFATFVPKLFFSYEAVVTKIHTPHGNVTQVECHEKSRTDFTSGYQLYAASVDSWAYVLAALAIAMANARISMSLRGRWRGFEDRKTSDCFLKQTITHDEETRKVTRMLSCVSAVYVIAWIPVSVHHFLIEAEITPASYASNVHLLLDCLFLSSLALSPIMLLVMSKRFHGAFFTELAKIKSTVLRWCTAAQPLALDHPRVIHDITMST